MICDITCALSRRSSRRCCKCRRIIRLSRCHRHELCARPCKDSILDTIGDTPLVRLSRIGAGLRPQLVAKLESFNPGGSIKDRDRGRADRGRRARRPAAARRHDRRADLGQHRHRAGDRRAAEGLPRDRGDAGQDVARRRSTCCAPTAPRWCSRRPTSPPDSPQSYYRVADRLTAEIPGAFQPNQYFNPANPQAHYESTGPELWEQTARADHPSRRRRRHRRHVTGTARYLRERKPDLVVIGADPEGSIYSGGAENVRPYLVEGVGEDFWPRDVRPGHWSTAG